MEDTTMPYTLEVCVDSTASALAAMQGGAHRLELCADLVIGGTTPSLALLQQVKAETGLPVRALLRPRFGDFCYDRWELAQMAQSAARLVEAGADGIVTGVLTPEGDVDVEALQPIYAAARAAAQRAGRPVACTLHRAFDVCRDPFAALEAARALGLSTILTSGQAPSAPEGAALLKRLVEAAGPELEILVGAGVTPENLPALAAATGGPGLPSLRQAGAGQPDDLPPGGGAHGPAGLFGVCALADRCRGHPPGPQRSGQPVTGYNA